MFRVIKIIVYKSELQFFNIVRKTFLGGEVIIFEEIKQASA